MSTSKREQIKFLETATPYEIMKYWRVQVGDKNSNEKLHALFPSRKRVVPFSPFPLSPRLWYKEARARYQAWQWARQQRAIDAMTAEHKKNWRLAPINPQPVGSGAPSTRCTCPTCGRRY